MYIQKNIKSNDFSPCLYNRNRHSGFTLLWVFAESHWGGIMALYWKDNSVLLRINESRLLTHWKTTVFDGITEENPTL